MAEIAGTAVGIVSLSIQTCQGLVSYIDGVKNAKSKAEQIRSETERLAYFLELLDNTISKLDPLECVNASYTGITACAKALESIRKSVGAQETTSGSKRVSFKTIAKRLGAPFKEADIQYKKDVLNSIQLSLQTALDALQIDQQRRDSENLERLITQLARSNMTSMQIMSDRHEEMTRSTLFHHREQKQLLNTGLTTSEHRFDTLNHEIVAVQRALQPISSNIASLAALSQLGSALTRMESKLDSISPGSTIASVKTSSLIITWGHTPRPARGRCVCHRKAVARTILRWPVSVKFASIFQHNADCPHATVQEVITGLRLELSICSFILGRKFDITLGYSSNAAKTSVPASLECIRFVTEDSPAFRLINEIHARSLDKTHDAKAHLARLESCTTDLYRLFETRQASPHDCLLNGQTLLHFTCQRFVELDERFFIDSGWEEIQARKWQKLIFKLVDCMPSQKNGTWIHGGTCLDIILSGLLYPARTAAIWSAARHLLNLDVQVSRRGIEPGIRILAELPLDELLDPILKTDKISEVMGLIALRSGDGLRKIIGSGMAEDDKFLKNHFMFYKTATYAKWLEGCSIMQEAGWNLESKWHKDGTMLMIAIDCSDAKSVQFWLDARKKMDEADLGRIGDPAEAYEYAASNSADSQVLELLLADLIQQRLTISAMMVQHDVTVTCILRPNRLLDAHAHCVLSALQKQGIEVPRYLWPEHRSVYACGKTGPFDKWPIHALGRLFEGGFQDISEAEVSYHHHKSTSTPLLRIIIRSQLHNWSSKRDAYQHYELLKWFLERGASLKDRWAGSNTIAAHIVGYSMGEYRHMRHKRFEVHPLEVSVIHVQTPDDCLCPCSSQGCLPMTAFLKTYFYSQDHYNLGCTAELRPRFTWQEREIRKASVISAIDLLSERIEAVTHRPIITETIRLLLFLSLGLRHTCCNFKNITMRIPDPYYFWDAQGEYPVHQSASYICRVKREDAYLTSLLEKLIPEFDATLDTFHGTFSEFVRAQLMPKMDEILQQLKDEDEEQFGYNRREMGVWMESEQEEEAIEELVGEDEDSADDKDEREFDSDEN